MGKFAAWCIDLGRSLAILYLMLWFGESIAHFVPIGVPGSIWGLLILFLCLMLRFIKLSWISVGAGILIRYMAVLFIPVSVGIIKYSGLLVSEAKSLVIPNIASTCITLVIIGYFSDYLFSRSSFRHLRRKVLKRRTREAGGGNV